VTDGAQAEETKSKPFGPFVLERRIAVGGNSEVFLARPKLGNLPAPVFVIKRIHPAVRERDDYDVLTREAELHGAGHHPNVVRVFGAGMVGQEPYLAMEYVEGVDLYRLLRYAESEERRLPPELSVYIAREVAAALESVHAAAAADGTPLSIVHRDVTPSNVYLSIAGDVKLGDFGIARVRDRTHPEPAPEALKGKFGYLAPEQVAGEPFDHRADLFALTALLGEMLIGERVFPGSGQLAVLLAIRDVDIEPLERSASLLPRGLFAVLRRGLSRHPDDRFQSAADLSRALAPYLTEPADSLRETLGTWVTWAQSSKHFANKIEGQIRDSIRKLRAARRASGAMELDMERPTLPPPNNGLSQLRRAGQASVEEVSFAKLVELIATGELSPRDEVALFGAPFRPIRELDELARHLLPSSTQVTGAMFEPGAPDYHVLIEDSPMLHTLARMRHARETGALFVECSGPGGSVRRKELYLKKGRLLHVASSERDELLGEYLVRRGSISRRDLSEALASMARYGGRLGDTLIAMRLVDAVDVFRAIRDQGRDRVASLCAWARGSISFYRGTEPTRVEFPLDLDLSSPMMAGVIIRSQGNPRSLLPEASVRITPGPRAEHVFSAHERGTAPSSLQMIPKLLPDQPSVGELIATITRPGPSSSRPIGDKEACAAIATAELLGWIRFES